MIMNKNHSGFTLLEVLIALLVLSVGLLGLASLQTRGLATGHNAYLRSQAVLLARDMVERIRANGNPGLAETAYSIAYDHEQGNSDCVTTSCAPNAMARFDIDQWLLSLSNTLPAGDGEIIKNSDGYQITVQWDANRSGRVDNLKSYTLNLDLRT